MLKTDMDNHVTQYNVNFLRIVISLGGPYVAVIKTTQPRKTILKLLTIFNVGDGSVGVETVGVVVAGDKCVVVGTRQPPTHRCEKDKR